MSQEWKSTPAELLSFEYRHPKNGDSYTVSVTREEVSHHMCEVLFEKLCAEFCECEPVGETNVVECRCDEYADEFERVQLAAPVPPSGGVQFVGYPPVPDDRKLPPADPVPKVHRYQVVKMLSEDGNKIDYKPHGPWVVMADVHDAHATRLQAENAALQHRLTIADQRVDDASDLLQRAQQLIPDLQYNWHANTKALLDSMKLAK